MTSTVFISYSRRNRPFAERLQIDLKRAGVDAWLDLTDIPPGEDFERRILPEIERRSHLILLASPEANSSDWVQREVAEASRLGRTLVPIRLSGPVGSMRPEWERLSMIEDAARDYWGTVRKLMAFMHAPVPQLRSLVELLNSGVGTVDDAARELGGTPDATTSAGRKFVQLPVAPSAYGMTWLFAPESVPLKWPESIAVLFNYTSQYPGTRHRESLDHWSSQVSEPWIVMVEGPVNRASGQYEMKADQPHEWADSIDAGHRVIEQFARGRDRVGYYFNSIVPLAFEIGVRSTMMSRRRRVYHFDARPATGQARYELVVDGWQ